MDVTAHCASCGRPRALASDSAVEARPPCECGASGVVWSKELTSTLGLSSEMVADQAPDAVRQVFGSDAGGGIEESAFIDISGIDGSEGIRVSRGGADARRSSADLGPAGLSDLVTGKASPKESVEQRASSGLVQRLNRDGARWSPPVVLNASARDEQGVDATSTSEHGQVLNIQVTTADPNAWGLLAKHPELSRESPDAERVVESMRKAIAAKGNVAGRDKITLLLDATDSPAASLRSVVLTFRADHGVWTAGLGFDSIWVVGPVVDLVNRLDVK